MSTIQQSASSIQTQEVERYVALSIVAPVYNEQDNLVDLVTQIADVMDADGLARYRPYEIILVNDGSTDATGDIIEHICRLFDAVEGVELSRNFGQSAALAAGIDRASGEIIVTIDADLQNDPADIPMLLEKLNEGHDCVSGHRYRREDPWGKRLPSALQTRLAKHTGPDINDFGCTLKAYRADAIKSVCLYGEGHRYIPAQLYDKGYSVTEMEVNHRPRENGSSKYGVGRLVRGFVDLLFNWFWVRYSSSPMHLMGGAGLFFMATGVMIGLTSVIQKYMFATPLEPRTPRLVLVALLIVFGLQLLIFGVLAEMITRLHYRDETEYRIARIIE